MSAVITNPRGAFQQDIDDSLNSLGESITMRAAGAISVGQIIKAVKTTAVVGGATVDVINADVATAQTDNVVGVAATAAIAAGDPVSVVVSGPAKVQASGSNVATDTGISAGASGQVAAATVGTFGTRKTLGFTLEATGATAGALKWVWVAPGLTYAS